MAKKNESGHLKSFLKGASALAAATALTGTPTLAQAQEVEEEEEIVVTGSRLRQTNLDSPVPVNTLGAETIDLSNALNVAEVIRNLPASGVPGLTSTNSGFSTAQGGVNTVELRNLGESRSLVLVNGRRHVAGVPNTQIVDFNMIPIELIERVEVVTGGASAVYGSDALAGVINVILNDDFEGLVINAQGGVSDREDDERFRFAVTAGSGFADGLGHAVLNASWSTENGFYGRDRADQGMATDCLNLFDFFTPDPADYDDQLCGFFSSFGANTRILIPNSPFSTVNRIEAGVDSNVTTLPAGYGFDRQPFRVLSVPTERFSFQTLLNYEVSPRAELFIEASFGRTATDTDIEPFAIESDDVFSTLPYCDTPAVGDNDGAGPNTAIAATDSDGDGDFAECFNGVVGTNPFVSPDMVAAARAALTARGLNEALYTDEDLKFGFARRLTEVGTRGAEAERNTFRFVTGLRGDLNDQVRYEVALNYARTSDTQASGGQVNTANIRSAFDVIDDGSGNLICRDAGARAEGCVPLDIFGENTITPDMLAYIDAVTLRQSYLEQVYGIAFLEGDVETGFLPDALGWVAGVESRNEISSDVTDALTRTGGNAGNIADPTNGSFSVVEFFGELSVPLLRDAPFARSLDLSLAGRSSEYDRGSTLQTSAWSVGLEWAPTDWLLLRAQQAVAVRAPNIGELFSPGGETFATVTDPCAGLTLDGGDAIFYNTTQNFNPALVTGSGLDESTRNSQQALNCYADPLVMQRVNNTGGVILTQAEIQGVGGFAGLGNESLQEETGETFTAGFSMRSPWDHPLLRRTTLSVDYFDITIDAGIGTFGRQNTLEECYTQAASYDAASQFCANVDRFDAGPNTGALMGVNTGLFNLAAIETSGLDVQFGWGFDFADVGLGVGFLSDASLDTSITYTQLLAYEFETVAGSGIVDASGTVGLANDQANVNTTFRAGPLTFGWQASYIGESSRTNDSTSGTFGVVIPEVWFHDIQVRWAVTEQHEVFFGVDNVADEYIFIGQNGDQATGWTTYPEVYDGVGRRFSVGTRLRF